MEQSLKLTIDTGNSSSKVLVYEKDAVIFRKVFKSLAVPQLSSLLKKYKPSSVGLCSVVQVPAALQRLLKRHPRFIQVSAALKLPFKILYETPGTLGADRIAAMCAALKLFPVGNVLVIDLGTCITYDFLNSKLEYQGGSISPGMTMRLRALHEFTDRLPLLKPADTTGFIGKSTRGSIQTGVQTGILSEMEGFIDRYRDKYGNISVILTGGDAGRFAGQLKLPIFAAPDLVNTGINEILNFNAKY